MVQKASVGEPEKVCFETLLEGLTRCRILQALWKCISTLQALNKIKTILCPLSSIKRQLLSKVPVHVNGNASNEICRKNHDC